MRLWLGFTATCYQQEEFGQEFASVTVPERGCALFFLLFFLQMSLWKSATSCHWHHHVPSPGKLLFYLCLSILHRKHSAMQLQLHELEWTISVAVGLPQHGGAFWPLQLNPEAPPDPSEAEPFITHRLSPWSKHLLKLFGLRCAVYSPIKNK